MTKGLSRFDFHFTQGLINISLCMLYIAHRRSVITFLRFDHSTEEDAIVPRTLNNRKHLQEALRRV